MVAVVSGNGLGLFNTSFTQLGTSLWGQAGLGQSRESQYVNIATGSLILQDWDEAITVRGFDATALRTYNSQGTVTGAGQDGFITGYERSLILSGTLNNVNSTVTLQTGDGQSIVFKYSGTSNQYVTTDGDGANDTLVWSGGTNGTWTYTEGSSRREELYSTKAGGTQGSTATAYLTRFRDLTSDGTTPAQYTVMYDGSGRVSEVRSIDGAGASADAIVYTYNGSGQLASISTREGGVSKGQVTYTYDGYGRLSRVTHQLTTDLSIPAGGGAAYDAGTAATFWTDYTYVTASASDLRIASVTTSDNVTVAYTYDASNRIATVKQGGAADGSLQTITFTYNANSTDVTDDAGRTWTYQYDASKQLTAVLEPAISGQRTTTTYTYTVTADTGGAGNVKAIEVTRAGTVLSRSDFSYDANGNLTWQWNRVSGGSASATAVQKTYNSANQVLTETVYTGLDSDGPATTAPTGGLTTNFIYDAQNRLRFVVDATGAVRELKYDTSGNGIGQVGSERRYTGVTYSGAYTESALNTWATSTQKASSQLTEYRYDAKGRVNSIVAYGTLDASGNGTLNDYADITWFNYDAHGLLLQKVLVHGASRVAQPATPTTSAPGTSEVTDYVYDGMGRLLTVLQRDAGTAQTGAGVTWDAASLLTQYVYLDTTNQVRVLLDSGAVRVESRNKAGLLTSVSEANSLSGATVTRTSYNYYDATGRLRASEDAAGGRRYFFYDPMGRLSAEVDAVGAVTAYAYDDLGRIQQTTRYATKVDTSSWLSGGAVTKDTLLFAVSNPSPTGTQAWVPTDAASDRTITRSYDALGRLLTETTATTAAAAQVTTYAYDGASRLTSITVNAVGGLAADARVTRMFYDDAGRLLATLDAAGYLTENTYDSGGRRVQTTAYAALTTNTYWASGTLAQLKTSLASSNDAVTRFFYDSRGQVVAELAYAGGTLASGSGYLTEYVYDEKANQRAVKAYAQLLTGLTGSESLTSLRTAAGSALRLTQRNFNGLGQLLTELNPEGAVTRYTYDDAGRLVRTEWAQGTSEVRESNWRYDVFGNLIGELGGQGSLQLLAGMSEAQLDAIYATYGTTHTYDLLGRRIQSTDALGVDGQGGNKTWFFYDAQSRLTFTVKGVSNGATKNALGEVTEMRYSAFGQVTDTLAYTGRISIAGTQTRADVQTALNVLTFVAASDSRRQFTYDRRGLLTSSIDAEGVTSNYTYTAFGQLLQEQRAVSTSAAVTIQNSYDKRGLVTAVGAYNQGLLLRTTSQVLDAFGRVTSTTDGTGAVRTFAYDRLGRQVTRSQVVEGRTEAWGTAYDAFSRVVSQTDALGKVTTLAYNDTARTVTVTSPEGIITVTTHDLHGQTVTFKNGANETTTYTYNRDGQLVTAINGLGITVLQNQYNERGLIYQTLNGTGDTIDFEYDAVGRIFKRIENKGTGTLNLTTLYAFDGQGRKVSVTDPSGVVTTFNFDREGRLTQQAIDPAGLNLRTSYTWDAAGRQLTVVQGVGATNTTAITTAYTYDALGRRLTEVQGSGSLNLTTTYVYDGNDNVIAKQDAAGNWTRYGYDEANRLRFTLSPAGNLAQTSYDANGRLFKVRQYANLVNMAGLGTSLTLTQLQTLATNTGTQATDVVEYRVFNNDGQMRYRFDGAGNAVAFAYDGAGRNTLEKHYAMPISPAYLSAALALLETGTATVADLSPVVPTTAGQDQMLTRTFDAAGRMIKQADLLSNVTRFIYDNAGRTVATIDAMGGVTRRWFDAAGREIASRQFATAWTGAVDSTTMTSLDQAMANSWTASDRQTYTVLDATGRVRFTIDGGNGWTEYTYDSAGRRVSSREHADPISIDATLQGKLFAGRALASMSASVNNATDRTTYWVYNETSQVKYIIDAAGYAKSFAYDAAGRQVISRDYAAALSFDQMVTGQTVRQRLGSGTLSVNDMGAIVVPSAPGYRNTYQALDGVGRVRFVMTWIEGGQSVVSEWRYDAAGHVTEQIQYATTIASALWQTPTQVAAALTSAGADSAANQRITRQVYDGAGRLRFVIDDSNAVSERRYDAAGQLTGEYRYDLALSGVSVYSNADLAAWATGKTAARKTTYLYDAIGQLARSTDNLGNYESFGYDAAGNRTSYTNKLGFTWNYSYDGAGRLLKELSPTVSILRYDANGALVPEDVRIATAFAYDAFGNVISKTDNADAGNSLDRRTVQYVYDNRGLQVRTIFPDAYKLDASLNVVASGVQPETQVVYDALGRAVVQKDVRGYYSYKVYDARGLLAYDVDAGGYVTAYSYNAYGEQTGITRYASGVNVAGRDWTPLTLEQVQATGFLSATPSQDRSFTFVYDLRGNKIEARQAALSWTRADGSVATGVSPKTTFQYDALGNLVKESVLIDAGDGSHATVWADTYHYFDQLGQRIRTVDAEGYVTAWTYDILGQISAVTEYANAISTTGLSTAALPPPPVVGTEATGYDRTTTFSYDAVGRKATEVSWRHLSAGAISAASATTTTAYDAIGQVTGISVTSAAGTTTTSTGYDKLGHVTTVTEQARQVLVANWQALLEANPGYTLDPAVSPSLYVTAQPITMMSYDAFGNVVWSNRFANGLQSGVPLATGPNDQSTLTRYDRQGRVLYSTDAAGKTVYYRYDAADHIVEQFYWRADGNGSYTYIRSTYTYDGSGRQLTTSLYRTPSGGSEVFESSEAVAYNAFGEIRSKAWQTSELDNAATAAMYEYDTAGRIVRSNAEAGAYRRYSFNLAGVQVREERDWTDGATNRTAVYTQLTDRLGRITSVTSPSYTSDAGLSATTSVVLDRWGNVLAQTDARGALTEWIYNEANQALRQLAPTVTVVSAAGVAEGKRPTTFWNYDVLGNLVQEKDPNLNIRTFTYDAMGRLTSRVDGIGARTFFAYDALGQQLATENALHYVTYVDYDKGGRAVEQGDFRLNLAGTARVATAMQTFVVDQDGNRLSAADARNGAIEGGVTLNTTQKYVYDARGNLLQSLMPTGVVTTYGYDRNGRKTFEGTAVGSQSWTYDYFGRTTAHTDLSGASVGYSYDSRSGQLKQVTIGGSTRVLAYNADGRVRSITEGSKVYTYEYDANGNRTLEKTVTIDGGGQSLQIETRNYYDALNRLSRVTSDDVSASLRMLDLSYAYDEAGNRRKVTADTSYGPNATPVSGSGGTPNHQELWFTYDAENRVLIGNGTMVSGVIDVVGKNAWANSYNAAGYVTSRTIDVNGIKKTGAIEVDLRGQVMKEHFEIAWGASYNGIRKLYEYDLAGHVIKETEFFSLDDTETGVYAFTDPEGGFAHASATFSVGGWTKHRDLYTYDSGGRALTITSYGRAGSWRGAVASNFEEDWNPDLSGYVDDVYLQATVSYVGGYDSGGRLVSHQVVHEANGLQAKFTATFAHSYLGKDGWLESGVSATTNVTNYRDSETASTYDAWGRRLTLTETTPLSDYKTTLTYKRYFATDAEGGILSRRDGEMKSGVFTQSGNGYTGESNNPAPNFITATQWSAMTETQRKSWQGTGMNQRFVYSNGQQVAILNKAGKLKVGDLLTGFESSELGAGEVLVTDGDTLASIAQRVYGNSSLWFVLADANAVSDDTIFAGQILKTPNVTTTKNDANTFKPYNPAEVVGPTEPNTPYIKPPPPQSCNALKMIIMIVVAVVVTVYTAGAAAGALGATGTAAGATGTMAVGSAALSGAGLVTSAGAMSGWAVAGAAFAGGVAGSVASQVVGKAMGVVDHFSLRGALGGGLTAAIGSGIGNLVGGGLSKLIGEGQWQRAAASAVLNNVAGYGVNKITGQSANFSWRSVAASAVSAAITATASSRIGKWFDVDLGTETGQRIQDVIGTTVGSVVSLHVRRSFGLGDEVHYGRMAADAFGNVLARALTGQHAQLAADFARSAAVSSRMPHTAKAAGSALTPMGAVDYGVAATSTEHEVSSPGSTAVTVASPARSGGAAAPTATLGTVYATGNGYGEFAFWRMAGNQWIHAENARFNLDDDVVSDINWKAEWDRQAQDFERYRAHQEWLNKGWEGSAVSGNSLGPPNQYIAHYNAINNAVGAFSKPFRKVLQALDIPLAAASDALLAWEAKNDSLIQQASTPGGAALISVPAELNGSFSRLVRGLVSVPRLVTNTSVMESAVINLEAAGSMKPSEIASAINQVSYDQWLRVSLDTAVGLSLSGLRGGGDVRMPSSPPSQAALRARVEANIAQSASARASSNFDAFVQSEGSLYEQLNVWPPNRGRIGPVTMIDLPPGSFIDRFGFSRGVFASPHGVPFADRALPSSYQSDMPFFVYEVIKTIPGVTESRALPWFGQRGMGPQYELPEGIRYLDPANGYVRIRYHEP